MILIINLLKMHTKNESVAKRKTSKRSLQRNSIIDIIETLDKYFNIKYSLEVWKILATEDNVKRNMPDNSIIIALRL